MATETKIAEHQMEGFRQRLQALPEQPRKLLVRIAELVYAGRGGDRKPGVAYMPELYESCGVEVNEMYPMLRPLVDGKFVELEGDYPFEDLRVLGPELGEITRQCHERKRELRDVLVDLDFGKLA
jgi:hypothetical protein